MFNYNYAITPFPFCSKLPQIHQNNHAMCRSQHLAYVDFNKPWALDSQNTAWSLQPTACHCTITNHTRLPISEWLPKIYGRVRNTWS